MSEKTERATPKKRRDARNKGQVKRSQEVATVFCCTVMFGLLYFLWQPFMNKGIAIFSEYFGQQSIAPFVGTIELNDFKSLLARVMMTLLGALLPVLGTAMFAGIAINIVQVGWNFTTQPLGMKFSRISPLNGLKRMFSLSTFVDLTKSILKLAFVGYIAYNDYSKLLNDFPNYVGADLYNTVVLFIQTAILTALKMCIAMAFIAAADYFYQWWKYEKDLKMTKQEVKDEYKMMEGDPQIKGKIRQKQRQMSAMRMMSRVPQADVVITNPTHYAVALRYDDKISRAPVVIAKGQDYIARKIKEIAIEYRIHIVENKPLAQSLYAMCEIDDEIPAEFYQAVADILVFVYKQKGKVR